MSKSVEELFRHAPADATHAAESPYDRNIITWFKDFSGSEHKFMNHPHMNKWVLSSDMLRDFKLIERPKQPQAWSGPEDGLPTVGTVCEVKGCMSHYLKWNKVTVFAVRGKTVMFDMEDGRWGQTDSHEFRAIQTPEQLRESAIRELMDIAGVDCRVTAARLVDAGFKREVV